MATFTQSSSVAIHLHSGGSSSYGNGKFTLASDQQGDTVIGVGTLSNGNEYVIYSTATVEYSGVNYGVITDMKVSVIDSGGSVTTNTIDFSGSPSSPIDAQSFFVEQVPLAGGGFVMVENVQPEGGTLNAGNSTNYFEVFNNSGTPVTGWTQFGDPGTTGQNGKMVLQALNGGGFVIGWSENDELDSYYQNYNAQGQAVGSLNHFYNSPTVPNPVGGGTTRYGYAAWSGQIAEDQNGNVIVGYQPYPNDTSTPAQFEIFNSSGTSILKESYSAEASLFSTGYTSAIENTEAHQSFLALSGGGFLATIEVPTTSSNPHTGYNVYIQKISISGSNVTFGTPALVETVSQSNAPLVIATQLSNGKILLEIDNDGSPADYVNLYTDSLAGHPTYELIDLASLPANSTTLVTSTNPFGTLSPSGSQIVALAPDAHGGIVAALQTSTSGLTTYGLQGNLDASLYVADFNTAPTVSSITTVGSSPNHASSEQFTVTFSEAVTGVDASDFTATKTGNVVDTGISVSAVSASVYTVTVNGVTGDGTLGLNLNSSGTGITDTSSGTAISGGFTGQTYTVDHTPPTVSSITATGASLNHASSETFTVTFSEAVTGVVAGDFALTTTNTPGGTALSTTGISSITGSGTTYTVTIGGVTGDGTLRLDLKSGDAGITDAAGNGATAAFTGGDVYTVDHTPPTVSSIAATGASPNHAGSETFTVTFSETVTGVVASDFALTTTNTPGGTALSTTGISSITGSGTTYTVTVNGVAGDGTLRLDLKSGDAGIIDAAGNGATAAFTGGDVYTVDHTPPTVSSIAATAASPNNAGSETFTVTFSEAVTGVVAGDFALTTTNTPGGTALSTAGISSITGSGTTYTVTVNGVAGDGTLRLDLKSGDAGITDAAGNGAAAAFTGGDVFTIEHTPPSVSSIVASSFNPNYGGTERFTVNFSENVTGVDASDFTVAASGTSDTGITSVSGSGSTYTVTVGGVTGTGTLGLNLNASGTGISDLAGNAISGGFTGGHYTVDPSLPPPLDSVMTHPTLTLTLDRSGVDPDNASYTAQNVVGVVGGGSAVEWLDPTGHSHTGYIEFLSASGDVTATVSLSGTPFDQLSSGNSALAALSNGDVVLTYGGQNGSTYFSVIGQSGVVVEPTVVTSSSTAGQSTELSNHEIAVASVVTDAVQQTSTLNIDFYSSQSANLGQAVGTPVQISSAQLLGADPIVGNNAGSFAVIYNSTADNQAHVGFYADAGGSPTATVALGASVLAQTVALGDGDFAVLTSDINYTNFKLQIYTPNGDTVGTAVSLPGIGGDIFMAADLTSGQQGVTVFSDNNDDGNVYAIRFDNTGNIVAGGTQNAQGDIASIENSGNGVEVYSGGSQNFLAGAAQGQAEGMVNLYLDQSNNAAVLQTYELMAPTVSSVEVPANGTYGVGQALDFTVDFNENVLVTTGGGTPYIDVTLDTGGTVHAVYTGGSGTSHLTFAYTVANGNADTNGVAVGPSIHLNGGAITDAGNIAAGLTLSGVASTTGVLVDAIPPTVTSIDTVDPSTNNLSTEQFTVTFSKAVSGVDASDFTLVGTNTVSGTIATVTGSGTTWTVTVGSVTGDGTLRLDLNNAGDAITDNFGNTLAAAHTGDQSYTIEHTPPAVTSVTVPANTIYVAGGHLDFTTTFSEAVTVTGTPRIAIALDTGGTVYATYLSGSGTNTLTYQYQVKPGDQDYTGIATGTAIDLNGGTITDAAGNAASGSGLNLTGEPSTAGVDVDAIVPVVSSVTVPVNGTYGTSQDLDFSVSFNKVMTVNTGGGAHTPYIQLTLDTGGIVDAAYVSGSGSSTLTFRYVVASGEFDSNGITVGSSLVLNGGTIQDAIGNNAATTLNNVGSTAAVLVDSILPTVSSIAIADAGTNNLHTEHFTVTFSKDVSLHPPDTTDFTLHTTGTVGGTVASVTAVNGSTYTITVTNVTGDGTLRLDLNTAGSAITDAYGNTLTAAHTGDQSYTIDHTAPGAPTVVLSHDTGTSGTDGITNNPAIIVTPAEAGGTLLYKIDGATSYLTTAPNFAADGSADGAHTVSVEQEDAAGNIGAATMLSFVLDTTAPAAPTSAVALLHDTGVSGTDHITSDPTLVFASPAAGDYFLFKVDNGSYSTTVPTAFATDHSADGAHTISVEEVDTAGNVSAPASFILTLDTVAPAITAVTATPSNGVEGVGQAISIVLAFGETVAVSGGTPTLSLNDGGNATYDAAATAALHDPTKLVFDYTVSTSDTITSPLAVTGIILHGAGIEDLAGNVANLGNVATTFTGLGVDTSLVTASPDSNHVLAGQTVTADAAHGVLANDTDSNPADHLSVSAVDGLTADVNQSVAGAYGSLTVHADGSYSYTANNNVSGVAYDTFTYTASNGHSAPSTSTLSVEVTGGNQNFVFVPSGGSGTGGYSNTVLDGSAGHATLTAATTFNAHQILIGGDGDTLNAASYGQDTFVFANNFGHETINNFQPALDVIQLQQSQFGSLANVLADIHQVGADSVLTLDASHVITIAGIQHTSLTAADFHLV